MERLSPTWFQSELKQFISSLVRLQPASILHAYNPSMQKQREEGQHTVRVMWPIQGYASEEEERGWGQGEEGGGSVGMGVTKAEERCCSVGPKLQLGGRYSGVLLHSRLYTMAMCVLIPVTRGKDFPCFHCEELIYDIWYMFMFRYAWPGFNIT